MDFTQLLQQLHDATEVFTVQDVVITVVLSFLLSLVIAWVYRETHRGATYVQSFVHTLILMSMVVGIVMLIIGSNIARAFTLVGALSIVRFRNAIKETRDVGFIFFAMAIGMACGTRFYLLAII
ncbi:membrane protein, partial [Litorilinea aerophila]